MSLLDDLDIPGNYGQLVDDAVFIDLVVTRASVAHPCRGRIVDYSIQAHGLENIEINDRRALILASSLDLNPPDSRDTISDGFSTYRVIRASIDPVGFVWDIQARR
jgi:hypothetical protein